jgi:hypothetical protein
MKDSKKDRVLGDEWSDWDGSEGHEGETEEKKRTFFVFSFFVVAGIVALSAVTLYLVTPRLGQISPYLEKGAFYAVLSFSVLLLLWYLSLVTAVLTGRGFFFLGGLNRRILIFVINKALKLGNWFGISRDRMANSFLKVFNIIIESSTRSKLPIKPLLILPRCLTKDMKEDIKNLSQRYELKYYIVGGGQAALQKIKDERPGAIIGVACERDLISGIKEVSENIPVLAISNRRPHGPCKDTDIDIGEMERAIRYFLKI